MYTIQFIAPEADEPVLVATSTDLIKAINHAKEYLGELVDDETAVIGHRFNSQTGITIVGVVQKNNRIDDKCCIRIQETILH